MCVASGVETQPRAHSPLSGTLASQVNKGLKGWVQTVSSREGFCLSNSNHRIKFGAHIIKKDFQGLDSGEAQPNSRAFVSNSSTTVLVSWGL